MDDIKRPKFVSAIGRPQSDGSYSVDLSYGVQYKDKTLQQVTEEQSEALAKGTSKEIFVYELVRVLRAERVVTPMDIEYERREIVTKKITEKTDKI